MLFRSNSRIAFRPKLITVNVIIIIISVSIITLSLPWLCLRLNHITAVFGNAPEASRFPEVKQYNFHVRAEIRS